MRCAVFLILIALGATGAGAAQPGPEWSIPSGNLRTSIGLDVLASQFPNSSALRRRQSTAALQVGDGAAVRDSLDRLAVMGYALGTESLAAVRPLLSDRDMARLAEQFAANRTPIESSRQVEAVPAGYRLVEGIAWDARRGRMFAATVVGRALLIRDAEGWRPISGIDGGSLFGLAIDDERDLLWIASGRVDETPTPETAFRGLIALDLATLRPVRRLAAPNEGYPADIAVGGDGTVYASDPASGAIYRAAAGDEAMSVLVPPGFFRNPQGIVPAADGERLYVADYVHGIATVELADGHVSRLESLSATMLDGIDGMVAWQGGLVAIQNGTSPRRILFLGLDDEGRVIETVDVLERANPLWGEPTLGFVRDGEFVYVADAQWERYEVGGALRGDEAARPTAIRALSLLD